MTDLNPVDVKPRLKALGLFGLIACCDQIIDKPWLRTSSPSKSASDKPLDAEGSTLPQPLIIATRAKQHARLRAVRM